MPVPPIKVTLELDRPREFLLDLATVARWEYGLGKPFFSSRSWDSRSVLFLLWAGLHKDATLRMKTLVRMVQDKPKADQEQIFRELGKAISLLKYSLLQEVKNAV